MSLNLNQGRAMLQTCTNRLKNSEGMKTLKFNGSSNTSKAAVFAQPLDKVSVQSIGFLM